ncbi:Rrf2 family transcriptional regulator [Phenylobacterium sp. Root77]|uniref:Rrf2 family transcriptional regulator n=1 Tax=unclassified Phenylobacterium TaxID=2640670 RepID=UPI0006F2DCD0|nr:MULTISPECIES: Rrf2 family transcriptional regulator [unclassified Phenylobacterium]KQW70995.1 Rrf2 family transcriptional regulator [Phenylobacterium sp. Root1277]KQW95847.1 Rrf2 family transcriptional regulator [Phenylobacterium sp. Root1290]KRC41632.1 Rrf2 family transcriptional regulator [Phenylobacterium sp. Root77]
MRTDSRLSRMLHALIHMDRLGGKATSEQLAQMLATNPVVVRRTMAGLRRDGLVASEPGHGGGWALARPLDAITLKDIYAALDEPELFAIGQSQDHPECLVEQAVNGALAETLSQARDLIAARFAAVTLGDLSRDFDDRFAAGRGA